MGYCKIPIQLLRIEDDGFHIAVKARINGRVANMLLDTGASKTVFDSSRILKFISDEERDFQKNPQLSAGLGTTSLESHTTLLKSFSFGAFRAKDFPAILLDLDNINQSYGLIGLKPIDGVIGSDLLVMLKAQLSLSGNFLRFHI